MVLFVASPNHSNHSFWFLATLITVCSVGVVGSTLTYCYYFAHAEWTLLHDSNQEQTLELYHIANAWWYAIGSFVGLCCLSNIGLLSGVIYWVIRMQKEQILQTGSLNLKFIFMHISLLLV